MGSQACSIVLLAGALTVPALASSLGGEVIDQQTITALEARVPRVRPREQCFLDAKLIHQMTELTIKQYAAGNVDQGNELLERIQQVARKLHPSESDNDKRLKNAEILLRRTAFRLNEMLHNSDSEERPLLEQTLAQVNKAENETMLEVFRK